MTAADARAEAERLLARLVSIESVNPELDARGSGEAELARFISGWLERRGLETRLIGDGERPSLIARRFGSGSGRTLLLNGHLDTVAVGAAGTDPIVVDGERMRGRGSYDMKSGLAAAMIAVTSAPATAGDVILAFSADEEFGSRGTEAVVGELAGIPIEGAVVLEPTGLELTVAHRGFAWFRLDIEGRAAHGSQPELGIDAIAHAAALMDALSGLARRLAERPAHPLLGASTVRIARIDAGTDAATVAATATLTLERRTLPGETPAGVLAELTAVLAERAAEEGGIRHSVTELVSRPAFEAPADASIVTTVRSVHAVERGAPPEQRGDPWWTDAALFADAGIPTVVFGVAGGGAHADDEWVDLASFHALTGILERVIGDFCAPAPMAGPAAG